MPKDPIAVGLIAALIAVGGIVILEKLFNGPFFG